MYKQDMSFVGKRFGRLVVIDYIGKSYWLCQCDCGKQCEVRHDALMCGDVKSCGCLAANVHSQNAKKVISYVNAKNCIDGTNLRKIDNSLKGKLQNNNTSGYTGVNYDKSINRYKAFIKFKGKQYYLGSSKNIDDCIKMRKIAEEKIFGDFLEWYNNK